MPRAPRFEALAQRAVAAEEKLLVSLLVQKWETEAAGRGLARRRSCRRLTEDGSTRGGGGTAVRGLPGAARNTGWRGSAAAEERDALPPMLPGCRDGAAEHSSGSRFSGTHTAGLDRGIYKYIK